MRMPSHQHFTSAKAYREMPGRGYGAAMRADETALLFANEAFYTAFADRDMAAMEDIWAKNSPVGCIHPGWPPLFGLKAVLESWERILANPASPDVETAGAEAMCWGDTGVVVCYEKVEDTFLVATNTFVREGKSWRLVYHQAGPVSTPPGSASNDDQDIDDEDEEDEDMVLAQGQGGADLDPDDDDEDDDDEPPPRSIH
ncbi:nuclear transport factor 2 family protein [Ferrovibrio sp.]|uniref:nuclear transport factor 2 family protein n=1 Tax=Ferrovibrio sp. TaxID=1917215 RepID=UPI0025BE010F|nr:nuclear transport factor 2 family protein [Ferrovibrio sp.]